jgi:hypothetical protein
VAATLTTILVKMRQNIIDLPSDTEDRLVGWVNEAQIELESYHRWLGTEAIFFGKTDETPTLINSGTDLKDKPSDWLHADGDAYWRDGASGANHFVEWAPSLQDARKDYTSDISTSTGGSPKTLQELQGSVRVYPTPDANNPLGTHSSAGEYHLIIPYRQRAVTLAVGSEETIFFTVDLDLALHLEDYASGQAMIFNRDFDNANAYLLKAQGHALRAKRMDKRRRFQSYKHTPRRDVYASRNQRRAV